MTVLILVLLAFLIISSISMLYLGSRVTGLPLPHAAIDSAQKPSRALAIVFSGPKGWIEFDQELAESLSNAGMDVRGIDFLRYFFWKKRTPAQLTEDLSVIMKDWLKGRAGGEGPIVLVGYSKGADVLPFATNLLEPELRSRIQLVALVSVSRLADFRLRLTELLQGGFGPFALKVGPEIKKLESIPGLCIYGNQDRVSLCRNLKGISNTMEVREVPSGRIFHDAKTVSELVLSKFEKESGKALIPGADASMNPPEAAKIVSKTSLGDEKFKDHHP